MLRYLGAALVIFATGSMGLSGVRRLRGRTRSLEGIVFSLELMEMEICSRLAPMREVLEKLSTDAPVSVRGFFRRALGGLGELGSRSFFSIWSGAVDASRELLLTPEETELLRELGLCLGRYDVREQAETISRVRRRFEAYLSRAEEERRRDTKLHAFFGVASGIFAVIILL